MSVCLILGSHSSVPNGKSALERSRAYATHPHLAGSKADFEDAKVILKLFQEEFGISAPSELPRFPAGTAASRESTLNIAQLTKPAAWIDEYYPVMNIGKEVGLEILGDNERAVWTADLTEDGDPRDPEAAQYRDSVPSWHGFSADGEAVGEVVYVNYGSKDDYENLLSVGTNFTGKIVLARYGANARGLKVCLFIAESSSYRTAPNVCYPDRGRTTCRCIGSDYVFRPS